MNQIENDCARDKEIYIYIYVEFRHCFGEDSMTFKSTGYKKQHLRSKKSFETSRNYENSLKKTIPNVDIYAE